MTKKRESHDRLHHDILERMYTLGEPAPETFCQVMDEEPGLLEKYLRSCGLQVSEAVIDQVKDESLMVRALMEDKHREITCEVRFIRAGG